jgi:hypothetical protein
VTDAERKELDDMKRQLVALANTFRLHVFPRLDRIETELQIDEPVQNQ